MSIVTMATHPLPYRPIQVIDVSPYRSSIRSRPAAARRSRGGRLAVAALAAAVLAVAVAITTAGAEPIDHVGDFRLAPGHAMPVSLAAD